jgi:hypothetical protein
MYYVSGSRKKVVIGLVERLRRNLELSKTNSKLGWKMDLLKELWTFLRHRKKLWLAPIIIVMLIIGSLLALAQGSVVAPFIYTLF